MTVELTDSPLIDSLRQVRLIVVDVDGTLTDGSLEYSSDGVDRKRFHAADGLGIVMAQAAGLRIAVMSGRTSASVQRRMADLKVRRVIEGVGDKGAALRALLGEIGAVSADVAYIGDDINDLPAFDIAGVRIAVADAAEALRAQADIVTERPGGRGAVREAIEIILMAQGRMEDAIQAYLNSSRGGPRQ